MHNGQQPLFNYLPSDLFLDCVTAKLENLLFCLTKTMNSSKKKKKSIHIFYAHKKKYIIIKSTMQNAENYPSVSLSIDHSIGENRY